MLVIILLYCLILTYIVSYVAHFKYIGTSPWFGLFSQVTWLASWTENVQNQTKYVMLNAASRLKVSGIYYQKWA